MRTLRHPWVLVVLLVAAPAVLVAQPPMVTKYLYEFDTLGSGHPNDLINDQPALLKAAAFFQARGGYGTLILEGGEYIVGVQELHWATDPLPGPDWTAHEYPSGLPPSAPKCSPLVAVQTGFTLEGCAQFTIQGGINTTIRYRDCLYYGTFLRTAGTDEVFSAAGVDSCQSCDHPGQLPDLLHAYVGNMFRFSHCDSITVRDLDLNGNIDKALLGGRSWFDGIQTDYDGLLIHESSNCLVDHVRAHHFGRDGLTIYATYADTLVPFATVYPGLQVGIDPADSSATPGNRTVLFNNRVLTSRFEWNGRQGLSWTGLSGLQVSDCDFNYNGAGRMTSQPGSGLDIEGVGGPMRVRHGTFDNCRFLHNRSHGIVSAGARCLGQQDFKFTKCVVKAGLEGMAIWPETRQMSFDSCEVYGNVGRFYEQPENLPYDPAYDLEFRHTNFHEEDDQWAYVSWTIYGIHDTATCAAGPHMFRFTKTPGSRVIFDHCGFYTNCRAIVRFYGRDTSSTALPYCPLNSTGPCIGCDSADDRYVRVMNCTFVNTGRSGCGTLTEVFSGKHTLVDSLTSFTIPGIVRGGLPSDQYNVVFDNCAPYCAGYTIDTIPVTVFPECKPYFFLHDTVPHWDLCDPANNVLMPPCSSDANCYSLTVLADSAFASVVGDVFIGTVNIQGRFFVDADVLFQNAEVRLHPGAEIIVQNGWTLDIENSSFAACNGVMWRSITAEDGATLRIRGSFMDDAESAVAALDGSTIWVDGTQFHNNRVGIGIPDVGLPYNNVACWVSNSTFYSAGAMPLPCPGQTTSVGDRGFAAFAVHRTTLDLAGGHNTLHTLSNGIVAHQSDVQVSDCRMQDIQPDSAYTLTGNGAGIFARGDQGYHFLRQQGYGMAGTPSFTSCRWGVYTEYMNVLSTDNRMLDMGTAHHVERSGYRYVDILTNLVAAHRNGMELRANDGAAHILLQGNDITFGDHPCANCKGYTGILVTEGNQQAHDARILNNSIHFLNAPTSRFGIALTAADAWQVADNTVLLVSNAHNRTGIQLEGCRATEVSCNQISSSDTGYPIAAQSAIRNMMGSQPLISCNEMDRTANGILFNGVAYNTDVRGNFFHNHKWPLHLDATAIIDAQVRKGNLWDTAAVTPVWGAWYEVSDAQSVVSLFLYDPTTVGSGTTQPPSWSPPSWFNVTSGANYDCADHHGTHYCSQFDGDRCADCVKELDEKIASDSLENDAYTEETQWILKADLYKKLDDSPALLDSLQSLEDFYDELQGSTTAAFKAIDDVRLALYDLDSSVVAQLQANRAQVEGYMALVKDGLEQLGDSTFTLAQRQAILTSVSGYRQNIADLSTWNATALQGASTSKVLTATGVQAANANITTSELIEANERAVNDIYLATIAKDVDGFTLAQATDLFNIASQCPMLGGNAVFKARSLYWLVDDKYDFDEQLLCLPHGIIVKNLTDRTSNAVAVIPNPAVDEATLVLDRVLDEPGAFVVFDGLGGEVMRHGVPIEVPRIAFSTRSLAPAIYHYQVQGPSGIIGSGKLTIIR
ncbi:MAG: hypothetical protein IPJ87_18085 [Flavobacteriales bacterium]|nr:hypothetical protein [Flavobacteriales bacterium]MBK9699563.1 hypothetical protein [Flavobacteriales bacterium]